MQSMGSVTHKTQVQLRLLLLRKREKKSKGRR
jgi:hypothetical protein